MGAWTIPPLKMNLGNNWIIWNASDIYDRSISILIFKVQGASILWGFISTTPCFYDYTNNTYIYTVTVQIQTGTDMNSIHTHKNLHLPYDLQFTYYYSM